MRAHRAAVADSRAIAKFARGPPATRSAWPTRSAPPPGSVARRISPIRKAKSYELSYLRSNTMPQSPFAIAAASDNAKPTVGIPGTRHAFNTDEIVSGDPGQQGTQMDALGHFAVLPEKWDGKGDFPSAGAKYYGGFTQQQVKPAPDSPLQKLGIDKAPPIVTTAVLLDAKIASRQGQGDGAGRAGHRQGHRGDAEGAGARQARPAGRRRALHLHRLGRQLERPRHREVLLHQGAGPCLRRAPS